MLPTGRISAGVMGGGSGAPRPSRAKVRTPQMRQGVPIPFRVPFRVPVFAEAPRRRIHPGWRVP